MDRAIPKGMIKESVCESMAEGSLQSVLEKKRAAKAAQPSMEEFVDSCTTFLLRTSHLRAFPDKFARIRCDLVVPAHIRHAATHAFKSRLDGWLLPC